jgi:hypothetical protein
VRGNCPGAYVWVLLPVFVGVALIFVGRRDADLETATLGRRFVKWGILTFVSFAVVFEGLIFNRYLSFGTGGLVLPLVLIAVGVFMLVRVGLFTNSRS